MFALRRLNDLRVQPRALLGIGIDERILDLIGQGALVTLERQYIVTAGLDDLLGDLALAACLASMVTMHPFSTSRSSRHGIP